VTKAESRRAYEDRFIAKHGMSRGVHRWHYGNKAERLRRMDELVYGGWVGRTWQDCAERARGMATIAYQSAAYQRGLLRAIERDTLRLAVMEAEWFSTHGIAFPFPATNKEAA
jgi:hypothetical protein